MQRVRGNHELIRRIKKAAPIILSCTAAAGTVIAVIFSAKAATKAESILEDYQEIKGRELKPLETVKIAVPYYIPTAIVCTVTIACIFGSGYLSRRQQMGYIAAYTALDRAFREYRTDHAQVHDYGEKRDIEPAVLKDVHSGKVIFYEKFRDAFFERTKEEVLLAEYHLNRNFTLRGSATLNEFYRFLDLPEIEQGDILGWSIEAGFEFYGYQWIDFENVEHTRGDGLKYYYISMPFEPTADFEGDWS